MRVAIVRSMPNFSMDVYADGVISGLKKVRPDWEIIELAPFAIDRNSRAFMLRIKKYYERFWRFPNFVKSQAVDIFHIIDHSEGHIINWLKNKNKPIVITCHDLINYFYQDNLRGATQVPMISRNLWLKSVQAMQYADQIVAVSNLTAEDTNKILQIEPARISIIPNAVEPIFQPLSSSYIHDFRLKQGIDFDTFCLLNVGNDHPRKNILTILKVVKILKEQQLPIHFWKAGAPFTAENQKFIQSQGIEQYVTYLGTPDKQTLVEIYNAANVLIAPSLHEGFGITILEAMACKTPVITSNVSAMPEVIGNAGVLVDPNKPQEIAEAVFYLYKDRNYYQELADKGLSRVKYFTWEKTAEQIAQKYEKLLPLKSIKTPDILFQ